MTVLLLNPRAPAGDRGRLARLHLWQLPDGLTDAAGPQAEALPVQDEVLVRAPQALLLDLDPSFQQGLSQVQALLRACLPQPRAALAWSLKPLPRAKETEPVDWGGLQTVGGASATVAFAVGALFRLRWRLDTEHPALARAQRHLHRLVPQRLGITALLQAEGPSGPGADPLDWPLDRVDGLDDKLDAYHHHHHDKDLQANQAHRDEYHCLVADVQTVPGNALVQPAKAATPG